MVSFYWRRRVSGRFGIGRRSFPPGRFHVDSPLNAFAKFGQRGIRCAKNGIFGASQAFLRQADFFFAQGGPVGVGRILLVGAAVGDVGAEHK